MWWIIAKREFTDLSRDGQVRWSGLVLSTLLLVALATGWHQQQLVAGEHESAARMVRETWLSQPPKDPHSAAHYGAYLFKPRQPLGLIDVGVSNYTGVAVWLEAHRQNEFLFRPAQDRTAVARFVEFTVAGAMQVLVPVLIALLVHTRFAGERESGTLRQLVATGVRPAALAAGKGMGISLALGVWLVPLAALGSAALIASAGAEPLLADAARYAALATAYLVYFVVAILIGLAVSARARTASLALAALVVFWAVACFVVPRAVSGLARAWYPTPSAFEFAQRVDRETYDGLTVHEWFARRAADYRRTLLGTYGVSRIDDLPVNYRGVEYLNREDETNVVWDRHYGALWSAFDAQTRVHQLGGLASPMLAVRSLSMGLAGADVFHHRHFAQAAEAYRRRMVQAMNGELAYGSTSADLNYRGGADLWARVPPFTYVPPTLRETLTEQRWGVASLATWTAGALLLALAATRMLRVE